jgi:hypothetical protein
MKNHSMGLFEFMRVYLTVTVGGEQKSGTIRAQSRNEFGGIKNTTIGLFENSALVFMERRDDLAKERAQSGTAKTSIPRFSTNILPPSFQIAFLKLAVGWLLADEYGEGTFKDPDEDEYKVLSQLNRRPLMPHGPFESESPVSYHQKQLSFSDLDQWLLKVFLLGRPGIPADYWGGPQGSVENAFQLSKLAEVSPPVANSWVNEMESSGYLRRIGRKKLIPLRPNALIEEWRGQYRFGDNRILPYRSVYPVSDADQYVDDVLKKVRSCNESIPLAISGHQACRLLGIKHSSARSMHIYFWGNVANVANSIGVVPAETLNDADVFLVEPKYPKSVFGGRVIREGIPICDILQCYLDLYNLPDRGREQADFVFENILSKIFEKGRA